MKDLSTKILENKDKFIISEVQCDYDDNAAYQSFGISKDAQKYRLCFLTYDQNSDGIIVTVLNTAKDLADLLGTDEVDYDELENLKIGESETIDNLGFTVRIW